MWEQFARTKALFGEKAMERLAKARVAVFGIGGVGGYVAEALARSGVGEIDLIDHDKVSLTNVNRQVIATKSSLGRDKVEVMKERILDINPECQVRTYHCFYLPQTRDQFDFSRYSYVVDAVDTVTAKLALAEQAKEAGVPIISSMGTGNKRNPAMLQVADIYETSVCPLARVMRRELKKRGIEKLKVVYSKEEPQKPVIPIEAEVPSFGAVMDNMAAENTAANDIVANNAAAENMVLIDAGKSGQKSAREKTVPGSTAFVPPAAGLLIASEVVKDLQKQPFLQKRQGDVKENNPQGETEGTVENGLSKEESISLGKDAGQSRCREIERSIIKKFHKNIWRKFTKAINDYELISDGDKIAVCISGGKDSMLMAKLFQELARHGKKNFEVVYLVMNPGYHERNLQKILANAKLMEVPIQVFESQIFDAVFRIEKSPCYLCARMRRGHLYSKAQELGCNKIALGHHFDDVIETILMGMLYGGQVQTMMPKLHSTNFPGMELIRPLYLVREADIIHWASYNDLEFIRCACRFTEASASCAESEQISKRQEVKELIRELKEKSPFIEKNIFRSVENVNLDTVIAYKKDGQKHLFLDSYERKQEEGKL